jgi:hypothetical protein
MVPFFSSKISLYIILYSMLLPFFSGNMDLTNNDNPNVEVEENAEEEIAASDAPFSLNKIWDDTHLLWYLDNNQKKYWHCLWCNENYGGWHATRKGLNTSCQGAQDGYRQV